MPIRATPPPAMSCLMPCDFAPGLSFPYPSKRLITPQMPSPAPRAITKVCNTPIALLKNSIKLLSAANAACPVKGHKKRRQFSNCRGHKSPRGLNVCRAAVFSCKKNMCCGFDTQGARIMQPLFCAVIISALLFG
ncbi:Uncharacterised protein [Clostridioides difficile]|nr:Uncharacterised protein [Clostridioides difficile]